MKPDDEIEKALRNIIRMISQTLQIDPGAIRFLLDKDQGEQDAAEISAVFTLQECNLCHAAPARPASTWGYCDDCIARMN